MRDAESKSSCSLKDFHVCQNILSPVTVFLSPVCEQDRDVWVHSAKSAEVFVSFWFAPDSLEYTSLRKEMGAAGYYHLLCVRHRAGHFTYVLSLNPWTTCRIG